MPSDSWPAPLLESDTDSAEDTALACRTSDVGISLLAAHGLSVVLWDWDGVLVDSRRNFYEAYERVLREEGIVTTPREIFLREGEPTPILLRAIFNRHHIGVDDEKIRQLVVRRREYDIGMGERKIFSTVPRLLRRLRDSGCRNGLVTGSSKKSLHKVLGPEQAQWFDVIVTADDVEHGKPDPEPFLSAIETLQAEPKACLVTENAPFGIQAAHAAGCAEIAICSTLSKEDLNEADWVVQDHDELEALLFGDGPRSNSLTPLLGNSQ